MEHLDNQSALEQKMASLKSGYLGKSKGLKR
jgi:hypothetical protein